MLIETQEMVIARKHWHIYWELNKKPWDSWLLMMNIIKLVNIKLWFMAKIQLSKDNGGYEPILEWGDQEMVSFWY